MPTLYSLTDELAEQAQKKKKFLKATEKLRKQLAKEKVEPYIQESVEQIHKVLKDSEIKKEDPRKTRMKIKKLLEDEKFKKGSRLIEIERGVEIDKISKAKNSKLLAYFQRSKASILRLHRYTIDSVKEYPEMDKVTKIVQEKTRIRVIEAVFNVRKFRGRMDRLTFSEFLDPKNWIEEDRELDDEVVDHHLTLDELPRLFPIKKIPLLEGRVILANKAIAFDITELTRQSAKESYKKLLRHEGKRDRIRRVKR
ncbi:MAG: hypothetical protein FK733_08165 [Asgard group archaeon]|nr:hypothetical protein [Asgard group archaeon]